MVVERLKLSCLEMEEPPVKRRRRQSALELTPTQTLKVTRMLTLHGVELEHTTAADEHTHNQSELADVSTQSPTCR